MPLRDLLSDEIKDEQRASAFAAHGRSMTGFSGQHTSTDSVAGRGPLFGDRIEPVVGERISRVAPEARPADGTASLESLIAGDPVFARQRIEPANRQPFGAMEQSLAWAPREGFRRYWFNDSPGRISRAKRAGYSHVIDPDTGESLCRVTDRAEGRGRSSYLMEIPIEWYQSDMSKQAALLARRLDDIRLGQAGPGAEENRYVPQNRGGIRIEGR